jgi:hypothetical protein
MRLHSSSLALLILCRLICAVDQAADHAAEVSELSSEVVTLLEASEGRIPKYVDDKGPTEGAEAIAATHEALTSGEWVINLINELLDNAIKKAGDLMKPAEAIIRQQAAAQQAAAPGWKKRAAKELKGLTPPAPPGAPPPPPPPPPENPVVKAAKEEAKEKEKELIIVKNNSPPPPPPPPKIAPLMSTPTPVPTKAPTRNPTPLDPTDPGPPPTANPTPAPTDITPKIIAPPPPKVAGVFSFPAEPTHAPTVTPTPSVEKKKCNCCQDKNFKYAVASFCKEGEIRVEKGKCLWNFNYCANNGGVDGGVSEKVP